MEARALIVRLTVGCRSRCTIEPLPVELPEQQRLAHVLHGEVLRARKICDRAGDAQDPAIGARGSVEAPRGELQQVAGFAIGERVALEIAGGKGAVQHLLAFELKGAGTATCNLTSALESVTCRESKSAVTSVGLTRTYRSRRSSKGPDRRAR